MKRIIDIVEAPNNLGLKKKDWEAEPGVKKLPAWLKKWGFYDQISPRQLHTLAAPEYAIELDPVSGVLNADLVAQYSIQLAEVVTAVITSRGFPVVIGGDCSILIGNMLALKAMGKYGLFYLDGHTDYAWPSMSATKAAAGMDLAIICGKGHHDKLTNLKGLQPYVAENHVWSVGNRDFDAAYLREMHASAIHYFDLYQARQIGLETGVNQFLEMVAAQQLDGFWIHLDVDVLNDAVMPAVDSRQADGLTYAELTLILNNLLASEKATGLNITILDPDLDPEGAIAKDFINGLAPVIDQYLTSKH